MISKQQILTDVNNFLCEKGLYEEFINYTAKADRELYDFILTYPERTRGIQ